jgi:hypothetical protein
MTDISMCMSRECPVAETCRRSVKSGTKPDIWQTYADFSPENKDGCDGYWHVGMEKKQRVDNTITMSILNK